MKIGIIGAGQIGGTLTRRLTALGHQVVVANSRGPETLSDLAAETGATAVSVPEAVRGVDLVVAQLIANYAILSCAVNCTISGQSPCHANVSKTCLETFLLPKKWLKATSQ